MRSLPGVESAGAVDNLPLLGGSNQPIAAEGHPLVALSEQPEVSVRVATPGYIQAMRIPLLEGRNISASDTADSAPVVVISQSMAKQLWPNQSPIGRHLKLSFYPDKDREVVGVVGDVKQRGLDSASGIATLYWPLAQVTGSATAPLARTPPVARRPHYDPASNPCPRGDWRHQPGEQRDPRGQCHDPGGLCWRDPDPT